MVAAIVQCLSAKEAGTMGRRSGVEWSESGEELYARYTSEREVGRRTRLQALWLVRTGHSVAESSRIAGIGQRSLERWLGWYRAGGLELVLSRVPGHGALGAPPRLTPEQQAQLLDKVRAGSFRTYEEARQWVAEQYGVRYGYQGMYSVLARLEVHPKVPRPRAAKADPAVQEAWKKGGSTRRSVRQE